MKFNKVLVTGASGFTGGWVLKELASRNIPIRAMVRDASKFQDQGIKGLEIFEGDLSDHRSLEQAVQGVDAVIHIAAIFRQAGLPDEAYTQVNVEGTRKLLEFSVTAGVKRFIHCSTVGVHSHIANPPADENAPFAPGDIYQRTKLEGELVAREFFEANKINGAVIRPAMIYGPGDQRTLKIFKMLSKRRFFYVGAGDQFVHFVDVRDLARAFVDLLEASHLNNKVYIIGGSSPMPLKDFIAKTAAILNVPTPWLHLPVKPLQIAGSICEAICTPLKINPPLYRRRVDFFTKNRHFDCFQAKKDLGFEPRQNLVGELVDIINSYIDAGHISAARLSEPCTIVRSFSGKIYDWDLLSHKYYGISSGHAIGRVTHEILKTKFPVDLKTIEDNVQGRGFWVGNLKHQRLDGDQLEVLSHWQLDNSGENSKIIEVNRIRLAHKSNNNSFGSKALYATGLMEWISPELLELGSFIAGRVIPAI